VDEPPYNGPYVSWRWQYQRGLRAAASCHIFPSYLPGVPRSSILWLFTMAADGKLGQSMLSATVLF